MSKRPTRQQAEEAVRTLISWAGDDVNREGLKDTPKRVVKAYEDFFSGYLKDPKDVLSRTFEEVEGYDDIVLLKDIRLESHCEHHMAPMIGTVHIAYYPDGKVLGLSKLARLVDIYGKRLQTQEALSAQIASSLQEILQPKGVAVYIDAVHQCMTTRGIHKPGSSTITTRFTGCFSDPTTQATFLRLIS